MKTVAQLNDQELNSLKDYLFKLSKKGDEYVQDFGVGQNISTEAMKSVLFADKPENISDEAVEQFYNQMDFSKAPFDGFIE